MLYLFETVVLAHNNFQCAAFKAVNATYYENWWYVAEGIT